MSAVGRGALAVATLAAAGSLAACGGGSGSASGSAPTSATATVAADGSQSITVHGDDRLMFAPMDINARVGALHVTFINDGTTAHTFRVKGLEPDTGNVNGHATATLTITLPHPGTYYVQCDYHPTMVGMLHVAS